MYLYTTKILLLRFNLITKKVYCSKNDKFGDFPLSPFLPPPSPLRMGKLRRRQQTSWEETQKAEWERQKEKSQNRNRKEKRGGNVRSLWWLIIFSLCLSSYVRDAPPSLIPTWPNKTSRRKEKDEIYAFSALFSLSSPPLSSCMSKEIIPPPLLKSHRKKGRHTVTLQYIWKTE